MNFDPPPEIASYLEELDSFIASEIAPLQAQDDNERFFDHRREWARTDWDRGGLPRADWEALLAESRRRADVAGHLRFALPKRLGGQDGSHLAMAVIREHLAAKGLGLFNDLQTEHSIVGNFAQIPALEAYGSPEQRAEFVGGVLDGSRKVCFALSEPDHGSDATFMETRAVRETRDGIDGWRLDGEKMWITGYHHATHVILFARSSGKDGDGRGITAFLVPADAPGVKAEEYLWTFNMPTDHPRLTFTDVWVPDGARFGGEGRGLDLAQHFVHQARIRQAASSLGAADFCVRRSVDYARRRSPFGKPLALNQGIQFPLVELATQIEMLRLLIRQTAHAMDQTALDDVASSLSHKVAMCNYWANRLVCEAADRAIQVHGGIGYSRHVPFEHIYRHHRRYRITEGAEEIQMRRIAAKLFDLSGLKRAGAQKEHLA